MQTLESSLESLSTRLNKLVEAKEHRLLNLN